MLTAVLLIRENAQKTAIPQQLFCCFAIQFFFSNANHLQNHTFLAGQMPNPCQTAEAEPPTSTSTSTTDQTLISRSVGAVDKAQLDDDGYSCI
jgi:hypothetical protein